MASEPVILPQAQRDVEEIVRYLARDLANPSAAARFLDEFDAKTENVCAMPEPYPAGRLDGLARLGFRVMPVMKYLVLYVPRDGKIVVSHVFHGTRDYARLV